MIGRFQYQLQYKEDTVEIEVTCVFCGKVQPKFEVSHKAWERYSSGALPAQEAFPMLSPSKRELLISAVCSRCWDEL